MTVATVSCPRCQTAFESGKDPTIRTCTSCDGVLLPRRSLQPLLTRIAEESLQTPDLGDSQPLSLDDSAKSPVGRCPQCNERMECFGYLESSDLVIDSCATCDLIWTDCDELALMAEKHARSMQVCESIYQARLASDESDLAYRARTRIRRSVRRLIR